MKSKDPTPVSPGYGPHLDVSVRADDGIPALLVDVGGELDLATSATLRQHLDPYNARHRSDGHREKIVYCLSRLEFIDGAGLRALLTAFDGQGPDTVTIRDPSAPVRRLLELVRLTTMIEEAHEEAYR